MLYPETVEEWWQLLETHWGDIKDILDKFIEKELLTQHNPEALKAARDPKMASLLQDAWWEAPDDRSVHMISGWGVLCNLCSESHLLEPEHKE